MKKLLIALSLFICTSIYAQKQYQLGTEKIVVQGPTVSNIKLVTYDNKPMGELITHTFFDNNRVVFTYVNRYENTISNIIMQVIGKGAAKGLKTDIDIQKSYDNPDQKTNPKFYWEVSVGFRKANDDVVEVGNTEIYNNEDGTAIINNYLGTKYAVPFATKAAAETFVKNLKTFLK